MAGKTKDMSKIKQLLLLKKDNVSSRFYLFPFLFFIVIRMYSGYATDGRIWYMKKKLTKGGEVTHAKILVLLYPKTMRSDVAKLIEVVKGW